jgi:hypothetical protein
VVRTRTREYTYTLALGQVVSVALGDPSCPFRVGPNERIVGFSVSLEPGASPADFRCGFNSCASIADLPSCTVPVAAGEARAERANAGEFFDVWGVTLYSPGVTPVTTDLRICLLVACAH